MAIFRAYDTIENLPLNDGRIVLREEQKEAIRLAKNHFKNAKEKQFLWNAKMRFGKTLCAMQLAKELNAHRTLIVTHRPVVEHGWEEDFNKIFFDQKDTYHFGTKFIDSSSGNFYELEECVKSQDHSYIFFASMQYLRRSELVGGDNDEQLKKDILQNEWDFVIVDEAHEGTRTDLGKEVLEVLKKDSTNMLHLSGTPFNLYGNFQENEIYTWDYVDEQKKKREWKDLHPNTPNPYAELPKMNIYTYELGKLINSGDFRNQNNSFSFSEFFRTWTGNIKIDKEKISSDDLKGKFVHEKEIIAFLNLLCKKDDNNNYPFSTDEFRDCFRHTLWVVPGVKEAKALTELLQKHGVFKQFTIINVAGNNVEDGEKSDALERVKREIGENPNNTRTITISCGRLTTGVTIKAWTAVLYLKGSENTTAATYMQTIFRVQSPANYNGQIKTDCYVFDFAPDRTLNVIAETARFSVRIKKDNVEKVSTEEQDKIQINEFLSFCPVLSLSGSQMRPYEASDLITALNEVYIDRVVRNGFNDLNLYDTIELMKLSDEDVNGLNELGEIIEQSTNLGKPPKAQIDINHQGLTEQQQNDLENARRKRNTGENLTSEEEKAEKLQRERERKERDNRVKILMGISLRIPLMMYGADVDDESTPITVDNFTNQIDAASWEEFMPRGVTKQWFNKFKNCYNANVFENAGKRIRAMAREADSMHIEDRIQRITEIFGYFHNPDKETVLTPWRVVNMHMSDTIGGYCFFNNQFTGPNEKEVDVNGNKELICTNEPRYVDRGDVTKNVFSSDSKILEINSKTGLYPLYVAYSLYRNRMKDFENADLIEEKSIEEEQVVWDDIIKNNLYVITNTKMAQRITKRTLCGYREVAECYIKTEAIKNKVRDENNNIIKSIQSKYYWTGIKNEKNSIMKFNAIVGNPPYQIRLDAQRGLASQIYPKFIKLVVNLDPNYSSLITPSRWFTADGQDNSFASLRHFVKEHNIFLKIVHYPNYKEIFPNVIIEGGINYFLMQSGYKGDVEFINSNKGVKLQSKRPLFEKNMNLIISDPLSYNIIQKIRQKEEPSMMELTTGRDAFGLVGRDDVVKQYSRDKYYVDSIELRCAHEQIRYMDRSKVRRSVNLIDKWKVFTSKGNGGAGLLSDNKSVNIIGKVYMGKPGSVCTDSLLPFGCFDTKEEAENLLKYMKSKFFRYCVGILKNSQNIYQIVYKFVPQQNFKQNADIDWSVPISEIDKQLYKKYELSRDIVFHIEDKIKKMD